MLTETIFGLAGIGKTIIDAVNGRDYVVIQGVTIVVAAAYIVVNLLVDVSYGLPRPADQADLTHGHRLDLRPRRSRTSRSRR